MYCLIKRNEKGNITNVTTPKGSKSKLFEAINSNPFLGTPELSVRIFATAYNKDVMDNIEDYQTYSNGEPKVVLKSTETGKVFSDVEDAILESDANVLAIGFIKKDLTVDTIATFDTNKTEKSRFIKEGIAQGIISPTRILNENGENVFQGEGQFDETRRVTGQMAKEFAKSEYGKALIYDKKTDTFTIPSKEEIEEVTFSDGRVEVIRTEDIPTVLKDPALESKKELILNFLNKFSGVSPGTSTIELEQDLSRLEDSLNRFLSSLGFTSSTLENYRKDYKTKYGQDPDIQAISDIANKVVAFGSGQYTVENLSEEIAHIAIEAYSEQDSIEGALAVVNMTPEYNEHAEYYRAKYSRELSGVELETKVRKEVLGKILKDVIIGKYLGVQEVTPAQRTVFEKLKDIWQRFLDLVKSTVTKDHIQVINELNNDIAEAIFKQDSNLFSMDNAKEDYFYSAMDADGKQVEKTLKEARNLLDNLFKNVLKQTTPNQTQLERISEEMSELDILSSINALTSIATNQKNILIEKVKESEKLDPNVLQTHIQLKDYLIPTLQDLRAHAKDYEWTSKENRKRAESIIEQIDSLTAGLESLTRDISKGNEKYVLGLVEEHLEEGTLDEDGKQAVLDTTKNGTTKDMTFLKRKFGLATNSGSIITQLLARLASKIQGNTTQRFRAASREALDKLYDNGWNKFEKNFIERDEKGNKTGYYWSPLKRFDAEKALKEKKIELLSQYSGKTKEEVTKMLVSKSEKDIVGTDKYYDYKQDVQKYEDAEIRESRMNNTYKEGRKAKMDNLELSSYTREYLSTVNNSIQQIYGKYRKSDGSIDLSKATPSEKLIIKNHKSLKVQNMAPIDQFGEYKHGLTQKRLDELTDDEVQQLKRTREELASYRGTFVVMQPGFTKENLPSESLLSFELNLWNLDYAVSPQNKKTLKAQFGEEIRKIEAENKPAYDWTIANGQIVLNDLYYDSLSEGASYAIVAEEYINSLPDSSIKNDKIAALKAYNKALRVKKDIEKQNKKLNQPLEMDVKNMDLKTRERYRQIEDELTVHRKAIRLPSGYMDVAESLVEVTSVMNEDYEKLKTERGLGDYEFCIQHMSSSNRSTVEDFKSICGSIISGYALTTGNSTFEKFIEAQIEKGVINSDMELDEVREKLVDEFAKTKVAAYFKRTEPVGYSEVIKALKNNDLKITDIMDQTAELDKYPAAKYISVNPDYSWTEDLMSESLMNDKYPKDDRGFYKKYKVEKWLNHKFMDHFGIDKQNFIDNPTEDLSKLVATKNQEEFEAYKTLMSLKEQALELTEETEAQDKFKMVQVSNTSLEKVTSFKNMKANFKDSVSDFAQDRSDELIYGEEIDANLKVIPRYFRRDLEDPNMISESVISSELLNLRHAILYTERKKAESDMIAFQTFIGKQEFKGHTGVGAKFQKKVKGQVSNYYQFTEEYVGHQLYGIQQNRHFIVNAFGKEIDLVKVASKLQGWSTLNNLAFNPLMAMTSLSTGVLNNVTDRVSKDRYHKSSMDRAFGITASLMSNHLAQAGKINKKDGLTAAMEINGILDDTERVKNSSLTRLGRIIGASPFVMDVLANKPVTPKVMLNVYCDTRYHNGKFVSWNEYQQLRTRDSINKKQIESEWYGLKNESLIDYVDLNTFEPNEKFKALPNSEQLWEKTMARVSSKIKRDVQAIDGVLSEADKVAAQRDVLTNFLLQHRGWFLINMARRFKKSHYNAADGRFEEGHYRSLWNFTKENAKYVLNPAKIAENYKELGKTNLNSKQNIKRSFVEVGIAIVLGLLGRVLLGDDDDDEEKSYGEVLAEYWYLKTYSEYNSSQIFGIPGTIEEMIQSPIPSSKFFSNYNPYSLLTNADEFEGSEDEPGINKSLKMLLQTNPVTGLPYKRFKTYGSKEGLASAMGLFKEKNAGTLFNLGPADKKED